MTKQQRQSPAAPNVSTVRHAPARGVQASPRNSLEFLSRVLAPYRFAHKTRSRQNADTQRLARSAETFLKRAPRPQTLRLPLQRLDNVAGYMEFQLVWLQSAALCEHQLGAMVLATISIVNTVASQPSAIWLAVSAVGVPKGRLRDPPAFALPSVGVIRTLFPHAGFGSQPRTNPRAGVEPRHSRPLINRMWCFRKIGDAFELRRLRRRLPYAYRGLIHTQTGIRTETDSEYLIRLRAIYMERYGRSSDDHIVML
jgi:hypothetical protein